MSATNPISRESRSATVNSPSKALKILAISASLKPEPSASRALLEQAVAGFTAIYPHIEMLDLYDRDLPFFDGKDPTRNAAVCSILDEVESSAGLLMAVPCYWHSVSGVFKNFIDVLSGAAYDLDFPRTVFDGKPVALIIVGADSESAEFGRLDAERVLKAVGAVVIGEPIVVANPRRATIPASTPAQITRLLGLLAKEIVIEGRRDHP